VPSIYHTKVTVCSMRGKAGVSVEPNVKRLSITNVKMLTDMQEQQAHHSSLEYAKEWLLERGNRPSGSTSIDSTVLPAVCINSSRASEPLSRSGSTGGGIAASRGSLPRKVIDDMAFRKLQGSGSRKGGSKPKGMNSTAGRSHNSSPTPSAEPPGECRWTRCHSMELSKSVPVGQPEKTVNLKVLTRQVMFFKLSTFNIIYSYSFLKNRRI